jgi:hypothetical protein
MRQGAGTPPPTLPPEGVRPHAPLGILLELTNDIPLAVSLLRHGRSVGRPCAPQSVPWFAVYVLGPLSTDREGELVWLGEVADRSGLTAGFSQVLASAPRRRHDPGVTLVQPILAGHGPTLFAGLSERLELRLVGRQEFRSGAVALRYQPSRATA